MGAGRLQRQGRLHPHRLQRLRDRGRQPAFRRRAQAHRPRAGVRALHRPAARARRHGRGRDQEGRPAGARRKAADDARGARRGEGRDAGLPQDLRRGLEQAHPRREPPGHRRRRGGALAHRRGLRENALHRVPAPRAHPPERGGAAADRAGGSETDVTGVRVGLWLGFDPDTRITTLTPNYYFSIFSSSFTRLTPSTLRAAWIARARSVRVFTVPLSDTTLSSVDTLMFITLSAGSL